MTEKLENLEAEGIKIVETQEERVARLKAEQDREREIKAAREQIKARNDYLKSMIPFLETELRYYTLQNSITKAHIERFQLEQETSRLEATLKPEEDVQDSNIEG